MARFLCKDGYVSNLGKVGKPVEESKEDALGSFSEYDVIIVGGGTAGCVLASRLSENTAIRVLLLESGKSSKNLLLSRIPAGFPLLLENKKKIYNFWTPPQEHTARQRQYWPRARMLGGCSAINAQIYHCGDPADYDEWARLGGPGAESWAYKDIHKYFLKAEKFYPSSRHPDVELSSHNESGPMTVGFFSHHSKIADRFIEACSKLGIPRVSDLNTPKGSRGVAKPVTYVDDKSHRVTTETAYLSSDVLARPNLVVAVGATVTKLLSEISKDAVEPRIVGVEFTRSKQGQKYRVRARKEVVLSAGALHTPQIMMLSGLGPAVELAKHDIPVVIDLPGVGQHLMDHATVDVLYKDASGQSLIYLRPRNVREALRAVPHIVRYFVAGKGGLTTQVGEAAAFVRSDDAKLFPEALEGKLEDTTSGPDAPDLELFVSPFGYFEHGAADIPSGDSLGLHVTMLRPTSTGTVTLKSKDPFELPVVDPQYLSTEHDRAVLLRGLKFILRLATQSPLADIIDTAPRNVSALWGHPLVMASDIELAEYVSKRLVTLYHPTSTARMSPRAEGGVVDPRLRVYGVQGLRVVDASIFPTIVSGHTAAPAIATAEKAADMIKEELESGAGQI